MYNSADIKKEILEILDREQLSKASEIFRFSSFGKSVYYRNGLDKDSEILSIIKDNRKKHKTHLLKSKSVEILEIRDKALEILRETKTVGGEEKRKNGIIYRIDFLCSRLHISTATFYDYNLHKDPDIRIELDTNRELSKISAYDRLLNSKQATGVLAFIKLVGNEEERRRVATSYRDIKSKQDIEIALAEQRKQLAGEFKVEQTVKDSEKQNEISLADEIKELMLYEYIEETDDTPEAQIIESSEGKKD